MTGPQDARGPKAVAKFLRPRSAAIVGISARPGSAGQVILQSLKTNKFAGEIHLVGRSPEPIDGRPVLRSAEELPEGVDLAIFTLPAGGVPDAVDQCVKRRVGSALIFAAGFAEIGDIETQERVTRTAREGGLALVGPNCLGYTNNVDGMMLHMLFAREARRWTERSKPGVAFVGQSGGMLGHMQRATDARGIPISYVVTTGNEAGLDLADFTEFLVEDRATSVIALYSEQIRRPQEFLDAVRRARAVGKRVVLLHPGKSSKAKSAAQSHTGALVGDYGAMRTVVEAAGALVVNSLDEFVDVTELLVRFPNPPSKGPGIITASGAFVALTNDFAEEVGLEVPTIEPHTLKVFNEVLPAFGTYGNPLDTTAGVRTEALSVASKALIDDPNVGMLFISYPIAAPHTVEAFNKGFEASDKPVVMVALGDTFPMPPPVLEAVSRSRAVFSRSSDRAIRAIHLYTKYGRSLARQRRITEPQSFTGLPKLASGPQPEWLAKKVLAAAGIAVPEGELARSADEAVAVARRVGFPVAMKAQAAALSHKTEAGGVILDLGDEAAVRTGWDAMIKNIKRAAPGVRLDGTLIEKMSARGVELMVGAKRDPGWGPVLLLGLGGIWVEALGDVRLLPGDASGDEIVEALQNLRTAKLLSGFRGAPPVDVPAVARTAQAIGTLMLSCPEIREIDVNPLMVHAQGEGATALDALIVTG